MPRCCVVLPTFAGVRDDRAPVLAVTLCPLPPLILNPGGQWGEAALLTAVAAAVLMAF